MSRAFIPAAGHDLLLPLYDPFWKLMRGDRVREAFIRDAGLAPGQRILDIGCGTGSLPVQIAETVPDTRVTGLDPDPKALARAARKAAAASVDVRWTEGYGDDLPYEDGAFDRVISTFMFHHLDRPVKEGMLRETRRVLVKGGELHLLDFGGHHHDHGGPLGRLLHTHQHLADNLDGGIEALLGAAGFTDVREVAASRSIFGRYVHVRGTAA